MGLVESGCGNKKGGLRRFLVQVLAVLLAALTSFSTSASVMAGAKLSDQQRYEFAQDGVRFYLPTDNCNSLSYKVLATKPSGNQITWIGDSYSVGAVNEIKTKFAGVDYGGSVNDSSSYIQDSKSFSTGTTANPGGLTILSDLVANGKLRDVLVYALGTNNSNTSKATFSGWIDQIMSQVGSTKVIFVTNYVTSEGYDFSGNNAAMREAAETYSGQVFVADWAAVAKTEYYASGDGVHPTGHFSEWVNVIDGALSGAGSSSGVGGMSGSDNKSLVWNYIASNYVQYGYAFTPEIIAGIAGNIKTESGFNPFALNSDSGMYGLFQTNNSNFRSYVESQVGNHWGGSADAATTKRAIEAELDYLLNPSHGYNWNHNSQAQDFIQLLDLPYYKSGEDGAAAYADLFLTTVEKAIGGSGTIWDPNVKEAVDSRGWATSVNGHYQLAEERRQNARALYNEYVGKGGAINLSYSSEVASCASERPYSGEFPQYYQGDSRWSSQTYGYDDRCHSTIGVAGCGPTSFAMMATALLGREILPSEVVEKVPDQYVCDAGSSWTITKKLADAYGLSYERISVSGTSDAIDKINDYLRNGWMFHVSGRGSVPFSEGGHYIGIYGITNEGNWLIADSSSRGNAEYTPNQVMTAGIALSNLNAIKNPNYTPSYGTSEAEIGVDDTADCYTGTTDLGLETNAYFNGQKTTIRLCSIPTIQSSNYSDGYVHVNARASEAYYKLGKRYHDKTGGWLTANEGFRTMAQQEQYWEDYKHDTSMAAKPGFSNHQGGLAVDFNVDIDTSIDISGMSCPSSKTFATNIDPKSSVNRWFHSSISQFFCENLQNYGLNRNVVKEPWHVSVTGN